jgi:uncharacterized tellurite resistance protein B-like protein
MALWKWLGLDREARVPEFDSLEEIERALPGVERSRRQYVACFAYILARSARADQQVTDDEARAMERAVGEHARIPADQAAEAVRLAGIQGRRSGGTDDFVVTRKFDTIATHAEKLALIDALFAITAVDASIVTIEDNEIRRISNELKIPHAEFIAVRSKHLQHLAVLRRADAVSPARSPAKDK